MYTKFQDTHFCITLCFRFRSINSTSTLSIPRLNFPPFTKTEKTLFINIQTKPNSSTLPHLFTSSAIMTRNFPQIDRKSAAFPARCSRSLSHSSSLSIRRLTGILRGKLRLLLRRTRNVYTGALFAWCSCSA